MSEANWGGEHASALREQQPSAQPSRMLGAALIPFCVLLWPLSESPMSCTML